MTAERLYTIADIDGSNQRQVTLAQYRAELEAAKAVAIKKYQDDASKVECRS